MNFFGRRLAIERKRIGFSQAAIAQRGGVKANAQVHYESGKRIPNAIYLASISDAGVDVGYLITGHRTEGPSANVVQAIKNELHNRLLSTAQRIAEISQLLDPSDTRTPRDHLADYLKFLDRNC